MKALCKVAVHNNLINNIIIGHLSNQDTFYPSQKCLGLYMHIQVTYSSLPKFCGLVGKEDKDGVIPVTGHC